MSVYVALCIPRSPLCCGDKHIRYRWRSDVGSALGKGLEVRVRERGSVEGNGRDWDDWGKGRRGRDGV